MNAFFDSLPQAERASARDVALRYGRTLYDGYEHLLNRKDAATSPYYVGLSSEMTSFTHVTKRVALVADTVLLSDHGIGAVHELGERSESGSTGVLDGDHYVVTSTWRYGMVTGDLDELGRWLLNAEPLLRSGLVWYGPVYREGSRANMTEYAGVRSAGPLPAFSDRSIDFVVEHGRAVDLATAKPLASRVVRPVLEVDLPFIDGLSLHDFARVTTEEFDSYTRFRDFMRARLLELDGALEAVDSQVALERVALSIRDELDAATAALSGAARTRVLSRSGAVLGTTSAVLAAVRPEALEGALAVGATLAAGATGLWPTVQAFAEVKPRRAQGKWHYVWVLQKKGASR
ncbi:hypothetical protein GCM10010302_40140 [Streptomyces polychromogenes]|uniref:Uncharacterized protein n=2 Tax=Streptomyces TaxID=1883 RepID=A0ABP3F6S7_9ACTN